MLSAGLTDVHPKNQRQPPTCLPIRRTLLFLTADHGPWTTDWLLKLLYEPNELHERNELDLPQATSDWPQATGCRFP